MSLLQHKLLISYLQRITFWLIFVQRRTRTGLVFLASLLLLKAKWLLFREYFASSTFQVHSTSVINLWNLYDLQLTSEIATKPLPYTYTAPIFWVPIMSIRKLPKVHKNNHLDHSSFFPSEVGRPLTYHSDILISVFSLRSGDKPLWPN